MKKKTLWFDVETTGLNPWKNGIIQFAALVEIDGEVVEEFETTVAPHANDEINPSALKVHGYSKEQITAFKDPKVVYQDICEFFEHYVNKFDRGDKFTPAGYNVRFDVDFLKCFFSKNRDKYYSSWFNWKLLDPMNLLHHMDYWGMISLPNYKLGTVCEYYGIELQAHDALSDIRATRELYKILTKDLTER